MIVAVFSVVLAVCAGCADDPERQVTSIYGYKADPTPENLEKLRGLVDDPEPRVRVTAVHALVQLQVPEAGELAARHLTDPDGFVRATAAKLVADVGDPAHVPALVARIREDSEPWVRQRAAEALERLGGEGALAGLVIATDDPVDRVRLAAVRGVRKLDPGAALPEMARLLLEDPAWEVRVQAAGALGESGDPSVLPVLEAAQEDPNEFVRGAVAKALAGLPEGA